MKQYLFIKETDAGEIRAKVQVNDVDANQHVTVIYMEGCKETYFGGVIPFKLGEVIHLTDIFTLAQTLSNEGVRVIEYNGDAEPKKLITSPELIITSSTTLSLEEEATSIFNLEFLSSCFKFIISVSKSAFSFSKRADSKI